jgi:hypothetical protein
MNNDPIVPRKLTKAIVAAGSNMRVEFPLAILVFGPMILEAISDLMDDWQ